MSATLFLNLSGLFTDIDFLTPNNNEFLTYDYLVIGDDDVANISIANNSLNLDFIDDANGSFQIYITAVDSGGLESQPVVLPVIINPVNDNPILLLDDQDELINVTFDEDSTFNLEITASDVDIATNGQSLNYFITDYDENLISSPQIGSDGLEGNTYIWWPISPFPDVNGTTNVTITVEDNQGGQDSHTFAIIVNAVNDNPFLVGSLNDVFVVEDAPDTVINL